MSPLLLTVFSLLNLACLISIGALAAVWQSHLRAESDELSRRHAMLADRVLRLEALSVPEPMTEPKHRLDRAETRAEPASTLISVPNLAAGLAETGPSPSRAGDLGQRFAAIWEMAETGASPEAIARASGQPIGQVELILGLKRQLVTTSTGGSLRS